jgi:hypothetical protein
MIGAYARATTMERAEAGFELPGDTGLEGGTALQTGAKR